MSDTDESANGHSDREEDSDVSDFGEVNSGEGAFMPYMDEPLARGDGDESSSMKEEDIDGIPIEELGDRYENNITVETWYVCMG